MLPDEVFDFIVGRLEGGARLVNDPADPGGLTRWGVSAAAYPAEDIVGMTRDRAMVIYDRDYWQAVQGDQLPRQVAVMVFDCAVNQGAGTARQLLQLSLGVRADGIVGPATVAAANAGAPMAHVNAMARRRWDRYRAGRGAQTYLRGWTFRLFDLIAACSAVAK